MNNGRTYTDDERMYAMLQIPVRTFIPTDLVLVRHGQSEGNLAKRKAENGDDSAFTREFREKSPLAYRLTKEGERQARQAGEFIRKEFHKKHGFRFSCHITSECRRAMETAALLELPDAQWERSFFWNERSWGRWEGIPFDERRRDFAYSQNMREREPVSWHPPDGEMFQELCHGTRLEIDYLAERFAHGAVIIVTHGERMYSVRACIERLPMEEAQAMLLAVTERPNKDLTIWNCEILHYTRRDPHTGFAHPDYAWMRRIRPTETPVHKTEWQRIEIPAYSSEELWEIAARLFGGEKNEVK